MSETGPVTTDTGRPQLSRGPSRRTWIAVGVVVVLVAAALAVNRAVSHHSAATSPVTASLIAKADLADCPSVSAGSAVAGGLPSLTLPCLGSGPKVDLAKLRGPLVVNVWAGPCPPCKVEAPFVQQFYAAAAGKVGVLGVVDGAYPDTRDDALDASRGLGLHYPSVFDATGKILQHVHTPGIPVSLFVRADGTLAYTKIGQVGSAAQLAQYVHQYLGVDVAVPAT